MIRRDFLGSLAALLGARFVKPEQPPIAAPTPPSTPVATSGFVQTDLNALDYDVWSLATNSLPSTHWVTLDYNEYIKGEGIRWNYTTNAAP